MQTKDKASSQKDLNVFFEPQAVAIIGVPRTPGFGYLLPSRLKDQGWADRIFLVNLSGGTLNGMPLYKHISQVPETIDLAVVMVPAPAVPEVLEDIGNCGIRHVILESAGFTSFFSREREQTISQTRQPVQDSGFIVKIFRYGTFPPCRTYTACTLSHI